MTDIMSTMVQGLQDYREIIQREKVRSISRRYFISNGFDGTLTCIGIAVGALLTGIPDGITAFKLAGSAAIGLATSGVWSVWEIERAEKRTELLSIENAMLTDLEGTELHRKQKEARIINAAMSGLGPTIGVMLPASAFLLEATWLTMMQATILAVALAVGNLFAFGA